jgi:hypothetical protein
MTPATLLIPTKALHAVLARVDSEPGETEATRASTLVNVMLKQNPSLKATDPKIYFNTLVALVKHYPPSVTARLIDEKDGLVANHQFEIKPSDVKRWLDQRMEERATIVVMAKRMLDEHDRRAKVDALEAKIQADRAKQTPEERAARAKEILKRMSERIAS